MGTFEDYKELKDAVVDPLEREIDDIMFMGNMIRRGCIIESFHRYGKWRVSRIYVRNGVVFLDVFRCADYGMNTETIRICDVKSIKKDSCCSTDTKNDTIENRINRIEKRLDKIEKNPECDCLMPDRIMCKDCSLFVYKGHLHPFDDGMRVGICRMDGLIKNRLNTCEFTSKERDDFFSTHSFDDAEDLRKRMHDAEKRLRELGEDRGCRAIIANSLIKIGEQLLKD